MQIKSFHLIAVFILLSQFYLIHIVNTSLSKGLSIRQRQAERIIAEKSFPTDPLIALEKVQQVEHIKHLKTVEAEHHFEEIAVEEETKVESEKELEYIPPIAQQPEHPVEMKREHAPLQLPEIDREEWSIKVKEAEYCNTSIGSCCCHEFTTTEASQCIHKFGNSYLVFVGDSLTRNFANQIFAFLQQSPKVGDGPTYIEDLGKHGNKFYAHGDMKIQLGFIGMLFNDPTEDNLLNILSDKENHPDVIVYNSGLWDIKYGVSFDDYCIMIDNLIELLDDMEYTGRRIWRDTTAVIPNRLDPVRRKSITNEAIELYNQAARIKFAEAGFDIIYAYDWTVDHPQTCADGYHYNIHFNTKLWNILFNMICP